MDIKIPGLKSEIGLGDVVKKVVSAVGIQQKPGCGCKARQERLNKVMSFKPKTEMPLATKGPSVIVPKKTLASIGSNWTIPPFAPEGWELIDECVGISMQMMFRRGSCFMLWDVTDGTYRKSHQICVGNLESAKRKMAERCH